MPLLISLSLSLFFLTTCAYSAENVTPNSQWGGGERQRLTRNDLTWIKPSHKHSNGIYFPNPLLWQMCARCDGTNECDKFRTCVNANVLMWITVFVWKTMKCRRVMDSCKLCILLSEELWQCTNYVINCVGLHTFNARSWHLPSQHARYATHTISGKPYAVMIYLYSHFMVFFFLIAVNVGWRQQKQQIGKLTTAIFFFYCCARCARIRTIYHLHCFNKRITC